MSNIVLSVIDAFKVLVNVMLSVYRRIQHFIAVAETLNFRAAARELNIAQPALSRSIVQLEDDIGVKLFDRGTRHVELTDAGNALLTRGRVAVNKLDNAVRAAQLVANGTGGTLRIGYGVFASMGPMPEMVLTFREQFPDTKVRLQLLATTEQIPALARGDIDLGFAFTSACDGPHHSIIVSREEFVVLASRSHPLARRSSVPLTALADAQFVLGNRDRWQPFRALVNNVCASAGFLPKVAEEADDLPVLLALVRSGAGIALHGAAIRSSLPPDVVALPVEGCSQTVDVSLFWSDESCAPLAEHFVEIARDCLWGGPRHYRAVADSPVAMPAS